MQRTKTKEKTVNKAEYSELELAVGFLQREIDDRARELAAEIGELKNEIQTLMRNYKKSRQPCLRKKH